MNFISFGLSIRNEGIYHGGFLMRNHLLSILIFTLIVNVITPIVFADNYTDWKWLNPLPQGNNLNAIWIHESGEMYAVGDVGTVIHWNGSAIEVIPTGVHANLSDVFGFMPDNLFVTSNSYSEKSPFLHWDGDNWSQLAENRRIRGLWGIEENMLFGVTNSDVYQWNETQWEIMPMEISGNPRDFHDIWGYGADDIFIVGDVNIYQSMLAHWDGTLWTEYSEPPCSWDLTSIIGLDTGELYVTGPEKPVYKYHGSSWNEVGQGSHQQSNSRVCGDAADDLWLVNDCKHWDGAEWTDVPVEDYDEYPTLYDVASTPSGTVWAVGKGGIILHGDSDGLQEFSTGPRLGIVRFWGTSPDDLFAVGSNIYDDEIMVHWDGYSWQNMEIDNPPLYGFRDIWGSNPDNIYITGSKPGLYKWDGTQVSVVQRFADLSLREIWGSGPDDIYVSEDNVLWHWDGVDWTRFAVHSGLQDSITALWGSGPDDVYVGSCSSIQDNLFHWDGNRWYIPYKPPYYVDGIWGSSRNDVFVVNGNCNIPAHSVSHWDGQSWSETDIGFVGNKSPRSIWGSGPDDVYIVGEKGLILHYNGQAWSEEISPVTSEGYDSHHLLLSGYSFGPDCTFIGGSLGTILHRGYLFPLGVRLTLPKYHLQPGDSFQIDAWLDNPGEPLTDVPLFVILEVYGSLYFWPSWSLYEPPESTMIDYARVSVPTGTSTINIIETCEWPDTGSDTVEGLHLFGALLNGDMTEILGEMAFVEWGYGP